METSTKSKHTPGPWMFYENDPETFACHPVSGSKRYGVVFTCRITTEDGGIVALWQFASSEESEDEDLANARLIAAAPDLLAALHLIADAHADCGVTYCQDVARDALAKAKAHD